MTTGRQELADSLADAKTLRQHRVERVADGPIARKRLSPK